MRWNLVVSVVDDDLGFNFWVQDSATFESALDWLCFNLPGDELPLKFSSGTASSSGAGMRFRGFRA